MSGTYTTGIQRLQIGSLSYISDSFEVVLTDENYVFDPNHTLAQITPFEIPFPRATLQGKQLIISGLQMVYKASAPRYVGINQGLVKGFVILSVKDSSPIFWFGTNSILTAGSDLYIHYDAIAEGTVVLDRPAYVRWKVSQLLGYIDISPSHTSALINKALNSRSIPYINTFSVSKTGKLKGISIAGQMPELLSVKAAGQGAVDRSPQHTNKAFNKFTRGALNTFSVSKTGKLVGLVFPYPKPGSAEYKYLITGAVYVPVLQLSRVGTTITINLLNPRPGYKVRLYRASSQSGATFNFQHLVDLELNDFPYVDPELISKFNYTYKAQFYISGEIDDSPVTVAGAKGNPRWDIVNRL